MKKSAHIDFKAARGEPEVVITSFIHAARQRAWKAYIDPNLVGCWWGPENLTTTVDKMKVTPGGEWRFVQHDPAGREFAFHGVYREIAPPERLAFTFEYEGEPGHRLEETVSFEERDSGTEITDRSVFATVADRDGMLKSGMKKGAVETMERFATLLDNMEKSGAGSAAGPGLWEGKGSEVFIIRVFDAPRALVWKAWTEPERVKRWWGPAGFTAPVINIDLCVGSRFLFCMRGPDGRDYWNTGVYREIVPGEKIVATDSFADRKGSPVPASYYGMSADYPREMLLSVSFEDEGGKTKFILRQMGHPLGKPTEQAQEGWTQSLDKLAASLREP
jgi:uncharacterized protein YndB with AHSA1/START domain